MELEAILFLMIAMSDVHCRTVCGSFTCNLFFGHVARHQMRGLKKSLSSASLETWYHCQIIMTKLLLKMHNRSDYCEQTWPYLVSRYHQRVMATLIMSCCCCHHNRKHNPVPAHFCHHYWISFRKNNLIFVTSFFWI